MTREEIMALISANNDRMKYLNKNNKLENEIEMYGYKVVKTYKVGRNTVYDLEPTEVDEWLQYQSARRIKKKQEHTIYVETRLTKGINKPRSKVVKELGVDISETSARRYDEMLLEDEAMKKSGEVYLLFNPNDFSFTEITKEEYNKFWSDVSELKKILSINKRRFTIREITEAVYDNNKFIYMTKLGKEQGVVALKYDTYSEYINTLKVLEMIEKHKNRG